MKFILYLMFFVTQAANLNSAEKKQGFKIESKHLWTLQNITQTEFTSHAACMLAGTEMVQNVGIVANLTVKGWCICAKTGKTDNSTGNPDPACSAQTQTGQPAVQEFLKDKNIKPENSPVGFTALPSFDPTKLPGYSAPQKK